MAVGRGMHRKVLGEEQHIHNTPAVGHMVAEAGMVAAIAVAEVASVVDTGGEVVRFVATVEMTPRRYVVAIVAVDIADMGLVAIALCIPLIT